MLVTVLNPQQLAYQVGDGIMCDRRSVVARATRFAVRANDVASEGGMRFSDEIVITNGSFALAKFSALGAWTTLPNTMASFTLLRRLCRRTMSLQRHTLS